MNNNNHENDDFFYKVVPVKLTEGRQVKLHTMCWGLLTDYTLESVKIDNRKGKIVSGATLRVCDKSGQTTCVVKGPKVGLLFGLTEEEWREVENLCGPEQQLYYRYYKAGLSKNFGFEQKLLYNLCATNQCHEALVATFVRNVNNRNSFKSDALLEILSLKKCEPHILDLYTNFLRKS